MKQIIKVLNSKMTLEEEFELEKQIKIIEAESSVKELKSFATELLRTGCKQGHFNSAALEIICDQQDVIFKLESKLKKQKKNFWNKFFYVLFAKK